MVAKGCFRAVKKIKTGLWHHAHSPALIHNIITKMEEQNKEISDIAIGELADRIVRLEYPTYEKAIPPLQFSIRRLRYMIELVIRHWLIEQNLIRLEKVQEQNDGKTVGEVFEEK